MSLEVESSLSQSTSRRTIVRTGAKLAYAAPLVAASMGVRSAGAVPVSTSCDTGYELINGACFEIITPDGCPNACIAYGAVTGSENYLCGSLTSDSCSTTQACPPGEACSLFNGEQSPGSCIKPC
jgi:hypothetical protein